MLTKLPQAKPVNIPTKNTPGMRVDTLMELLREVPADARVFFKYRRVLPDYIQYNLNVPVERIQLNGERGWVLLAE
jgi:hypothetical protein